MTRRFKLTATETTVFEYAVGEGSTGVMTHFWMTGDPAPGSGTDNATVRYYVDGEASPSIEFKPPMAAGVGFDDALPNWGNAIIGRGSDGAPAGRARPRCLECDI